VTPNYSKTPSFYHTLLCYRGICCRCVPFVCLSVHLFITCRCCAKMALCSITQSTLYDSHRLQFSDAKNFGEIPTGSFDVVRWATHIPKHAKCWLLELFFMHATKLWQLQTILCRSCHCFYSYPVAVGREVLLGMLIKPLTCELLFCPLDVLDPRDGHTMDVLFPYISVFCHSDWLFHG